MDKIDEVTRYHYNTFLTSDSKQSMYGSDVDRLHHIFEFFLRDAAKEVYICVGKFTNPFLKDNVIAELK